MDPVLKDLRLPLLATVSLHIEMAEEAFGGGSIRTAEHELEKAEGSLAELREEYKELKTSDRGLLAAFAAPLAKRVKELRAKMPRRGVLSDGEAVEDPEQDVDPEKS